MGASAVIALLSSVVSASSSSCLPVSTVENFDVATYASKPWYVQEQAPNAYTRVEQNRCVTAQYSVRDKKSFWGYKVDVLNYAEDANGNSIGGGLCADYDENMPSQLKVAPCFLPKIFAGPYWVVAYNETEGYALVSGGQPTTVVEETGCGPAGADACCRTGTGINNSGLWILTRDPTPGAALVEKVEAIATAKGFSTSVFFDVDHTGCDDVPMIDGDRRNLRG